MKYFGFIDVNRTVVLRGTILGNHKKKICKKNSSFMHTFQAYNDLTNLPEETSNSNNAWDRVEEIFKKIKIPS